jgi:phage terminase small subunit
MAKKSVKNAGRMTLFGGDTFLPFQDEGPIKPQEDAFCRLYLESNQPVYAYRTAFALPLHTPVAGLHQSAMRLLRRKVVRERLMLLRSQLDAITVAKVSELVRDWHDIATADPNEIVAHQRLNCRHCHGVNFDYQWKNAREYGLAVAEALDAGKTAPGGEGGYGYRKPRDPHPDCPHCYGLGEPHVFIADTRALSGKARKLYKGVKHTKAGIEIQLHDQAHARECLARVFGAFKDLAPQLQAPAPPPDPIAIDATPEAAQQAYLSILG